MRDPNVEPRRVALYVDDLWGGGMQKVMATLGRGFVERGHAVDLVTGDANGPLRGTLPSAVRIVELPRAPELVARLVPFAADPGAALALLRPVLLPRRTSPTLPLLPALARYLEHTRPDGLVSAGPYANLEAIWARARARVPTRILATLHLTLSERAPSARLWQRRYLPALIRRTYVFADAIAAVCDALGDDVAAATGLPRERIRTLYNPVVSAELEAAAREPVDHPWFQPGAVPVLLGVGRIGRQKDFATLIRAFARARQRRPLRLLILGEAKQPAKHAERVAALRALAGELGVAADVDLPGFATNPFAYMARARLFALSSRYEGLGNVLIEAMACGCPVVSTDCPVGPAEILEGGRWGPLVPVGDDVALADAILRTLEAPLPAAQLRLRAQDFGVDRAVEAYLAALFGGQKR